MKKSDLKTGMRVKMRNNEMYLVFRNVETRNYGQDDLAFARRYGYMLGHSYNDDLTAIDKTYDIMEVYAMDSTNIFFDSNVLDLNVKHLIWKRQEFTEEQKEVFKALKLLGFNFMAKDNDGESYAYIKKPHKTSSDTWIDNEWNYIELSNLDKTLFNFINWEDKEPFEIPA